MPLCVKNILSEYETRNNIELISNLKKSKFFNKITVKIIRKIYLNVNNNNVINN